MIDEITVDGAPLTTVLGPQITGAQLTMSRTQVTNLTLTAQDDPGLRLTSSIAKVLTEDTRLRWDEWSLTPKNVTTGGSNRSPVVKVTAISEHVHKLQKQTGGKSWGSTAVSPWAKGVIATSGATAYVQPALGTKEIERKEVEGNHTDPENTWDVLAEIAKQTGAWLYEDGGRIVLAKPSWLVTQPGTRRYDITYNTWTDHTEALTNAPQYDIDYDKKPWEGREQLTLHLVDPRRDGPASKARPGDIIRYTGTAAPVDPVWIITHVQLPPHWTQPTVITCWRPVDPPEIVDEKSSTGDATAGAPVGPLGAAGWSGEQLVNAAEIVREGQRRGLPELALTLAVQGAMGESSLVNIGYGDVAGPDSTGLFQQRDTWGSRSDRMSPAKAAGFFYAALVGTPYQSTYDNGGTSVVYGTTHGPGKSPVSASLAIHNVQRNAVVEHYARFWSDATLVVRACINAGSSDTAMTKATGPLGQSIDRLMASYDGKSIDVDGAFGAQCVDLAAKYITDLFGIPMVQGNGRDYWKHGQLMGRFAAVPASQNPRKGDVVSWSGTGGAYTNGGYGHVAIYSHTVGGIHYYLSQNPGPSRIMPLQSDGILGWMRPSR